MRVILSGCLIINDEGEVLLLYRKGHGHYETPGGKVEPEECVDFEKPTRTELAMTAERELREELGTGFTHTPLEYFGSVDFIIPDGRQATAHKFVMSIIEGEPKIMEPQTFSGLDWLSINNLHQHTLSPDLRLLLPKLQEEFLNEQ